MYICNANRIQLFVLFIHEYNVRYTSCETVLKTIVCISTLQIRKSSKVQKLKLYSTSDKTLFIFHEKF